MENRIQCYMHSWFGFGQTTLDLLQIAGLTTKIFHILNLIWFILIPLLFFSSLWCFVLIFPSTFFHFIYFLFTKWLISCIVFNVWKGIPTLKRLHSLFKLLCEFEQRPLLVVQNACLPKKENIRCFSASFLLTAIPSFFCSSSTLSLFLSFLFFSKSLFWFIFSIFFHGVHKIILFWNSV